VSGRTPGQAAFEAYERAASGDPEFKPYPWEDVDPRGRRNWEAAAKASRDELLDALQAVREAIAIPQPATVGDGEVHDRILGERVMHARVMLDSVLRGDSYAGVAWNVEYLREQLAKHPAEGYKNWDERVAELEAALKDGGAR
jgi:hypothetical protein